MTNTAVWKDRPLSYGLRDTDDDGVFQDQWEDKGNKKKKKEREGYGFS